MVSKITTEPTIEPERFLVQTATEKMTLAVFRDPVCLQIVNPSDENARPLQCSNCDQIFCVRCANDLSSKGSSCPSCKTLFNPSSVSSKLIAIFETLPIACRYKRGGCEFTSKLSEIARHEGACRFLNDQLFQYYSKHIYHITTGPFSCGCGSPLKVTFDKKNLPSDNFDPTCDYLCKICNRGKKISKSGILSCEKCRVAVCEECIPIIKEKKEIYTCSKNHLLLEEQNNKESSTQIDCDTCGFIISYNRMMVSCQACKIFRCSECNYDPFTCKSDHILRREKDFRAYGHEGPLYKKNMFECDNCHGTFENPKRGTLHCGKCLYDLCDGCMMKSRRELQRYCPKHHQLLPEDDMRKFSRDPTSSYAHNIYFCDVCREEFRADEHPALHCKTCEFDVCRKCAALHCRVPVICN